MSQKLGVPRIVEARVVHRLFVERCGHKAQQIAPQGILGGLDHGESSLAARLSGYLASLNRLPANVDDRGERRVESLEAKLDGGRIESRTRPVNHPRGFRNLGVSECFEDDLGTDPRGVAHGETKARKTRRHQRLADAASRAGATFATKNSLTSASSLRVFGTATSSVASVLNDTT